MSAILGAPWRQAGATIEDSDGCTVAVMSVRHDGSGPLLAAAPELLAAVADYLAWMTADFDDVAEMFYRDARMMAPGKSISPEMNDGISDSERRDTWDRWLKARKAALADTARAALAKAKGTR